MPIDITMPALSPTMEAGTLAKWHVKVGDRVAAGDVIAEIETDKATMEVEAVDEGEVLELLVEEGTEDVAVNAVIARLREEGEEASAPPPPRAQTDVERKSDEGGADKGRAAADGPDKPAAQGARPKAEAAVAPSVASRLDGAGSRIVASPLARRMAALLDVDLAKLRGSGPRGRIVKADVEAAATGTPAAAADAMPAAPQAAPQREAPAREAPAPRAAAPLPEAAPAFEEVRLSNMRKTIARRLTESKQTVPHFYLTVDVRLDSLLKLRAELNSALEPQGVKLSVNDMLVKALGLALAEVPGANVSFGGDHLRKFARADVSVAVAIPGGLITPVIRDAAGKRLSVIAAEMKDLAARAREGKLQPGEYTGGTASLSNLGMYGIKQFDAVINPPEGMILAVGAGEKRPAVIDGALGMATLMSATGSFDHRAIDGAVGAELMAAFRRLVERPLAMLA